MAALAERATVDVDPCRFDIGFVPSDGGGYRRLTLSRCWNERFECAQPVRAFVSYKGQKNFCGLRWVAKSSSHVGYESWLERDHLTLLDFDPQVVGVASQPFALFWHDGRRERRHTPDYFARLMDGSGLVVDVKPDRLIKERDVEAFTLTMQACGEAGWEYRRVGELDPVYRANLRWLAAYRHPRFGRWPDPEAVLAQFANPTPLFAGARAVGVRLAVLPMIYHLMWQQRLTTDLRAAPLHGMSILSIRRIGEQAQQWGASANSWMPGGALVSPPPRRETGGRAGGAAVDGSTHVLKVGDRVRWHGSMRTVTGLSGKTVTLVDGHGAAEEIGVVALFADAEMTDLGRRPARLASGTLALLPEPVLAQARWWEEHIVEVLTGLVPGSDGAFGAPRPEFDPGTRTLAEREKVKAEELAAEGHSGVSAGTVRRKRLRYEARGLEGLVDWRNEPKRSVRVDERVVAALRQVIEDAVNDSTRTGTYLMWKTQQVLTAEYGKGVVVMPSRATFFRLLANLTEGRHTTGSAKTRRSMASQPRGLYGVYTVVRPGELMEIDSTPLDVAVRLPAGVVGRVELTGMIDVGTRSVTAVVVRPTTKSVDASLLLARTVTPELMRPGWADALRMSRSVLPYRSMLSVDERLADAAGAPVIVPEVIVCDQGAVFISNNFRAACRQLGIDLQPAPPGDPTKKPHIERMMSTVATQFAQYLAGYLGSSPERRGLRAEKQDPLWTLPEIQHLLDEWLITWHNRPHDGLRDPLAPGRLFTPNEKYAALVEAAGYVPVALGASDYIELLPAEWRAINHYGVRIGHRIYDGKELNLYRRRKSGVEAKRGLWEIHHDPYDISRIWVRNHLDGGWITVFWKLLRGTPAPFGELAWNHELARLRSEGKNPTEHEVADAVQELLARANAGPAAPEDPAARRPTHRDTRVAGRTLVVGPSLPPGSSPGPRPAPLRDEADGEVEENVDEDDVLAEVVPLGVFDARAEARKRW